MCFFSSSALSSSIASALSFSFASSSSCLRLANHFFIPPSPAYGFVPFSISLSLSFFFPFSFPLLFVPSRGLTGLSSVISVICFLSLCRNMSGTAVAPFNRVGNSGVLYTSNSCKAISALLTGQRCPAEYKLSAERRLDHKVNVRAETSVMDPVPNRIEL